MAFEKSSGLNVATQYGPRGTGGEQGVFKTEGYANQYVIDGYSATGLQFLFPRGDGIWVTGKDYTFALGTVTSITVGGVEVSGATDAAPIRLLSSNTGEVVVTGLTGGKVVVFYKNVAGDKDATGPAFPQQPPLVASVSIAGPSAVVSGAKINLVATVLPAGANQGVVWYSSDLTKATVNSQGQVTGVAAGAVTITARSVADNTKFANQAVTVS